MGAFSDYFGIVGRDPNYEFNTNPNFPNAPNQTFLNHQFDNVTALGTGWLRVEFHVERDNATAGTIDYNKWDWFIAQANSRGLKLLVLLGNGIIINGIQELNLPADKSNGTNGYIRGFADRAAEIFSRYPGQIAAWEILNEPNVCVELYGATNGTQQEISPDRFGTLIAKVRRRFDSLGNTVPILVGGLLKGVPIENPNRYTTDFLESLYSSKPITLYSKSEKHFPWDGVAIHPYPDLANPSQNLPLQVEIFLTQIQAVMSRHNEPGKIWITELGLEASANIDPSSLPKLAEQQQLDFMRAVVARLLSNLSGSVIRLFWFKLEDFSTDGHSYYNWGLVRLKSGSDDLQSYAPDGSALRYKSAFSLMRSFTNFGLTPPA